MDLFLASPSYNRLIGEGPHLREIQRIGSTGSHLQKGTVSWCYENLIPLRHADFDGLFVTYEELALNPVRSCDLLVERLHFTDRGSMLRAFSQPATNMYMSSAETRSMMGDADEQRRRTYLVTKWQNKTTSAEMAEVSAILSLFGLDVYSGSDVLPHARYLHFDDTRTLLRSLGGGREQGRDRLTAYSLTHLRQLEAESIHIIREVAAEFENPVMLYSIGKDSPSCSTWRRRRSTPAGCPSRCCTSTPPGSSAR